MKFLRTDRVGLSSRNLRSAAGNNGAVIKHADADAFRAGLGNARPHGFAFSGTNRRRPSHNFVIVANYDGSLVMHARARHGSLRFLAAFSAVRNIAGIIKR